MGTASKVRFISAPGSSPTTTPRPPPEELRIEIASRLRTRSAEIERVIYARLQEAVPDPNLHGDGEYQAGVRATIAAVVEYGVEGIERGPGWLGQVPAALGEQARLAARRGVSLGTVLRRYVVGHGQFGEFVVEHAWICGVSDDGPMLYCIRKMQQELLEHITASVESEYEQERSMTVRSSESRRIEVVQKLLADVHVDVVELAGLDYEIHRSWHVGMIVRGVGVDEVIARLRACCGCRLLAVPLEGDVHVWLAAEREPSAEVIEHLTVDGTTNVAVAIGEPGSGVEGWRLTHLQARDAMLIALHRQERFACYAADRLLAGALQNDTLIRSLRQTYLLPLSGQRDGGEILRRTLRAYISLGCNETSASYALHVGRRSVKNRIRTVERLIGSPLYECLSELDIALRIDEFERNAGLGWVGAS